MKNGKVQLGLVGAAFIADIHIDSIGKNPYAEALAVASPSSAPEFARKHGIPHAFSDYRQMLELPELDAILICCPNRLHCEVTEAAASAGKAVFCEKPLCMNLAEADRMVKAVRENGVPFFYAEELCFTPKYVRVKQLADEGALGDIYHLKQSEKHSGPHMPWFWDVEQSGGGVTLDMGCHAVQFFRWFLGNPKAVSVTAEMGTYVHRDRTRGDDQAVILVEFEREDGSRIQCMAEESWAKFGGMDDRVEVYGSEGVAYANLLMGNAIQTFSNVGVGYAVEKADIETGWMNVIFEENWNYGFPQEVNHFVEVVRGNAEPLVTVEDGRATLEILFAAYASAGQGRRIDLPFQSDAKKPIDLWKPL
ncbi:MAG: Gfo/Idh/MocA family oxidoreductase [Armatimonadetes bacterium]|nr:Gfo/Idh/MocA family oxidoreductase [Armatimonadota bacterium]